MSVNNPEIEDDKDPRSSSEPLTGDGLGAYLNVNRGCTDLPCCLLFVIHWIAFIGFVSVSLSGGAPTKLYKPRDYKGDYCGAKENWNNGLNLKDHKYLVHLMNVSSAVDDIAKQLVCSSAAEAALQSIWASNPTDLSTYMCGCCKSPCGECFSVLGQDDLNSGTLSNTISGKMIDLTDTSRAVSLYSAAGSNAGDYSSIWSDLTKWFNGVCVTSCADATYNTTHRYYHFTPPPDVKWKKAWTTLATHASSPTYIKDTISKDFRFLALPSNLCPYEARYCVPWPGVAFEEVIAGFCTFKMPDAVLSAVGATAETLNIDTAAEFASQGLGNAFGDAVDAWDAILIVSVIAFLSGILMLVLLRFLLRPIIWCSLLFVFIFMAGGGCAAWVRAGQCVGTSFTDTGSSYLEAAQETATNAVTGTEINTTQEALTGNGADYRGMQVKTRSGRTCQAWAATTPHPHTSVTDYPNAGLTSNYCRNPMESQYIWCYTTDPDTRWEFCNVLGVQPWHQDCPTGYKVKNETSRDLLRVFAVCCWVAALLWFITICCLYSRIALAISLNEVAADFLRQTPQTLFVPIVQAILGINYVIFWMFCAAFILSKVPDDYVSTDSYATYAEAYGTQDTPGECTKMWPPGYVWKYGGDNTSATDVCSGNMGDPSGITPKCWRCMPPRYIFSTQFAIAFFSLLWNNAFLIACGQCVIAGAVATWFFAQNGTKQSVRSVSTGLGNVFRYHIGSLAFGSLILAIVQFIRYMLMYYQKQMEQMKNRVAALILRITVYLIWCLEKCLKFLSKNAYIQVAIKGTNFCRSAKNAFDLILRNGVRFLLLATLSWITNMIVSWAIIILTCFLGFFILQAMHSEVSVIIPMLIFFAISWVIAKLFMTVFQLSVDAMLQCFLLVEEDPDARAKSSLFVPGALKEHVHGKE